MKTRRKISYLTSQTTFFVALANLVVIKGDNMNISLPLLILLLAFILFFLATKKNYPRKEREKERLRKSDPKEGLTSKGKGQINAL